MRRLPYVIGLVLAFFVTFMIFIATSPVIYHTFSSLTEQAVEAGIEADAVPLYDFYSGQVYTIVMCAALFTFGAGAVLAAFYPTAEERFYDQYRV